MLEVLVSSIFSGLLTYLFVAAIRVIKQRKEKHSPELSSRIPATDMPDHTPSCEEVQSTPLPQNPPRFHLKASRVLVIILSALLLGSIFLNIYLSDSYKRGYSSGYAEGSIDGYSYGRGVGYDEGYDQGYSDGWLEVLDLYE